MSNNWKNKIIAFLYPAYAALLEKNKIEVEWKSLVDRALGANEISDEIKRAHKYAKGLDIPWFAKDKNKPDFKSSSTFKHLLSGRPPLEAQSIPQLNELEKEVQDIIEELRKNFSSNPKKFYLALWRLLPKRLAEKNPLWTLMPTDARVPCYYWWIYNSIASAFTSALDKPALLQFTIASPQDFIADARRTQDFWMASYIYSYFSWIAIKHIISECGPDCIIFPNLYEQPMVDWWLYKELGENSLKPDFEEIKLANITNLFTAIVPEKEAKGLAENVVNEIHEKKKEIGCYAKEHIKAAISGECKLDEKIQEALESIRDRKLAESIKNWLNTKLKNDIDCEPKWNELWERQIKDWLNLELFWTIYPWPINKDLNIIFNEHKKIIELPEKSTEKYFTYEDFQEIFKKDNNYGTLYQIFSQLSAWSLTTRKNLRDFYQSKEEEHKCSLCGKREALHPEWIKKEGDHYPELRAFWDVLRRISNKYKLAGRIRRGERLCGVCLTKRLVWEAYFLEREFVEYKKELEKQKRLVPHILFPSTASIATAKFKLKVIEAAKESDELRNILKDYVDKVSNFVKKYDIFYPAAEIPMLEDTATKAGLHDFLRLDGDWLYPESFDKKRIEREYGVEVNDKKVEEAREVLERLLSKAKELRIRIPSRYFVIIAMDIDKMGDWLNGKRAPKLRDIFHEQTVKELRKNGAEDILNKKRPIGAVSHATFSNAVKNFGLYVIPQVIEKELCGKLIYSGGDDLLALLPIEDLLPAMSKLHNGFMGDKKTGFGKGSNKIVPGGVPEDGDKVSISAGVAILHYTHPLSHAVEEVWEAEKEAKDKIDRDAFTIHLLKRAGVPTIARAKWEYGESDVVDDLQNIAKMLKDRKLSPRLMYDMGEEKLGLIVKEELNVKALISEFKRLAKRHSDERALNSEERKVLFEGIPGWFEGIKEIRRKNSTDVELKEYKEKMWEEVCNLLMIARFIGEESDVDIH